MRLEGLHEDVWKPEIESAEELQGLPLPNQ